MKPAARKKLLHFVLSIVISVGSVLLDRHVAPDLSNAIKTTLPILTDGTI